MEKWQDIPKSESALCQPLPAGAPSLPQAPPAPSKPPASAPLGPPGTAVVTRPLSSPGRRRLGPGPSAWLGKARPGVSAGTRLLPNPPPLVWVWAHPQARRWEGAAVRGWERHVDSDCDLSSGVESAGNQREMGLPVEGSPRVKTRGGTLAP